MVSQWPKTKSKFIQDWPEPCKVKDIQSFLGFANFYCCFIYEYSRIIILLMHLTCKNVPWNFTDECHSAFNTLRKAFCKVHNSIAVYAAVVSFLIVLCITEAL